VRHPWARAVWIMVFGASLWIGMGEAALAHGTEKPGNNVVASDANVVGSPRTVTMSDNRAQADFGRIEKRLSVIAWPPARCCPGGDECCRNASCFGSSCSNCGSAACLTATGGSLHSNQNRLKSYFLLRAYLATVGDPGERPPRA
jgi:hypothetical protein